MTPPDAGRVEEIVESAVDMFGRSNMSVRDLLEFVVEQALTTHAETIRQLKDMLAKQDARIANDQETIRRLEARLKVRCVKHGESEAPLVCEECVNEDMSSMDETIRRLEGEVAALKDWLKNTGEAMRGQQQRAEAAEETIIELKTQLLNAHGSLP